MNYPINNSTGNTYAGTIFSPFSSATPSEYVAEQIASHHPSIRKAPIVIAEEGWTDSPDYGNTSLSKSNAVPIGEPWVMLLFALSFSIWNYMRTKKHHFLAMLLCFAGYIQAGITALSCSPTNVSGGASVTITPTITSVPDGTVYVCWGLYYDAACTSEVADIRFSTNKQAGLNAVTVTAPSTAGTYFVKTSLYSGRACQGLMDSYYVTPIAVYPSDADIVLARDGQDGGVRVDINSGESMKAYGALRFSREELDDEELSEYERYNYFISFPFDVQVADIYGLGTIGTHWRISFYDGKGRAEEGFFAERTTNWAVINDTDSILHAGQGYLLQLNAARIAEDEEDIWVNDADVATLFFPAHEAITSVTTVNETIPALSEAFRCTIDLSSTLGSEGDRRTKDSYWRCIGVPGLESPAGVVGLPYLYEWNKSTNSLRVISSDAYTFLPAHAYLVQNGNEFVWTDVAKPASAIVAREQEAMDAAYYEFRLDLQQEGKTVDRTFIRITEDGQTTKAFDFGQDLIKECNDGQPNIYTLVGYEQLAANCLPMQKQTTTIPVGLSVSSKGRYTFAIPDGTHSIGVMIVDKQNGNRTDMNTGLTYSVMLEPGTYNDRFLIEIAPIMTNPTDVCNSTESAGVRKVMKDGLLYILRGDNIFNCLGIRIQ